MTRPSQTIFAGPDKKTQLLRDTLLKQVNNTPSGGTIRWMCYYFYEPVLLDALISAAKRGVKIEIIVEGRPRTQPVSQLCREMFEQHPCIDITYVQQKSVWEYMGITWHPHMHSKLYYFSHPTPHVLVGSYNPTAGPESMNESLVDQIGNHALSHNVLVRLDDASIVEHLLDYVMKMKRKSFAHTARISNSRRRHYSDKYYQIYFLPRLASHPVTRLLAKKTRNAQIRCAISHLKGPAIARPLLAAARHGNHVEIILGQSKRRVSGRQLSLLDKHEIKYHQLDNGSNLLMHNKFIICQSPGEHGVLFGSFNWSMRSWWLNHEILVYTKDNNIVNAFEQRWQEMLESTRNQNH